MKGKKRPATPRPTPDAPVVVLVKLRVPVATWRQIKSRAALDGSTATAVAVAMLAQAVTKPQ